jgi:hypothetical protein
MLCMHVRSSGVLERAVRYGVVLDHELGAVHAWTFMANNGVSRSVILRVLLDPDNRRQEDQLAIDTAAKCKLLQRQSEAIWVISGLRVGDAVD